MSKQPNIIVIMSDEHDHAVAGCYAQQMATSLFNFGSSSTKSCDTMGLVQVWIASVSNPVGENT